MKAVVAVLSIILVKIAAGQHPCGQWKQLEDYCYMKSCQNATFSAGQTYCLDEGGDLTSISTEEEFLHVASLLQDSTKRVKAWVGLRRRFRKWRWTDGTYLDKVEFTQNYLDQWGKKGDCVYMRTTPSGKKRFDGLPCDTALYYVCRKRGC